MVSHAERKKRLFRGYSRLGDAKDYNMLLQMLILMKMPLQKPGESNIREAKWQDVFLWESAMDCQIRLSYSSCEAVTKRAKIMAVLLKDDVMKV